MGKRSYENLMEKLQKKEQRYKKELDSISVERKWLKHLGLLSAPPPNQVFLGATGHKNTRCFIKYCESPTSEWRNQVAALMRLLPPVPLFRRRGGGALTFTPEPKEGMAEITEIVPFTVRLGKVGKYAHKVKVTWFVETAMGRAMIEVEVGDLWTGVRGYGYRESGDGGWRAFFPFRVQKQDRFWAPCRSDGSPAPSDTVAWWTVDVAGDCDMDEVFRNLTDGKEKNLPPIQTPKRFYRFGWEREGNDE